MIQYHATLSGIMDNVTEEQRRKNIVFQNNQERLNGMNFINMPPDASSLMESTRAMGYSLQTAVADIVDNSIAAEASRVDIFFSPVEMYVAFLDNGTGMDEAELNRAMKYGSANPLEKRGKKNDLGRFGLGMKTASLSQCEVLTVVSKKNNTITARQWNLNYIRQTNSWTLLRLSLDEMEKLPRFNLLKNLSGGTLIVWQELDRMIQGDNAEDKMSEKMDMVRGHLSLVFHRYLAGEEDLKTFSIFMNNLSVEPSDPFLQHRSTQRMDEYSISVDNYPPIKIIPYMLPYPSKMNKGDIKLLGITEDLQKNQGFYIYRSKRLIVWGTWFNKTRKDVLSQLARIKIDIPSDFDHLWALDVKKSNAVPPSFIRKNLDSLIENLSLQSKKAWEHRGKNEIKETVPHFWNRLKTRDSGVIYEINAEHPLISKMIKSFPECAADLKKILKLISASLPFNYLMKDLNDNKTEIENKNLYSEDDVRKLLEVFTMGISKSESENLSRNLKHTEPFSRYPRLIEEILGGKLQS